MGKENINSKSEYKCLSGGVLEIKDKKSAREYERQL